MKKIKRALKEFLPDSVIGKAGSTWDSLKRANEIPGAYFHPWRRDSIDNLKRIKNIHVGERCFIIGNGPSLRKTDLSKLKDEYTIGMNRIYMLFDEIGFNTSYYLSVNDLVIEQCAEDIKDIHCPKFLSWRSKKWVSPLPDLSFLYTTYTEPKFAFNAWKRLWEGATVTYVAMQLAFHLGFDDVFLIGVDHSFTTKGKPNSTITSHGNDPNHFDSKYFGKGFRWQLPDLETSERAYVMARESYKKHGRNIYDATIGGKLTVFPKVLYKDLF